MFKYQEEIVDQLIETVQFLETITDKEYHVELGYTTDNKLKEKDYIYLCINDEDYFRISNPAYEFRFFDTYNSYEICNINKVTFYNDLFLRVNNLVDKIYSDIKKERNDLYLLNEQLKLLNKNLKGN